MSQVTFQDDSGRNVRKPGRLRRCVRFLRAHPRVTTGLFLVAGYLLVMWLVSAVMVDESALQRRLTGELEHYFGADVEIDRIETEASVWSGCTVVLRGVRVESPSPDFRLPPEVLYIRKITMKGGLISFFKNDWDPEITLLDWELHISVSPYGTTNFSDLFYPQGDTDKVSYSPLLHVRRPLSLRRGKVMFFLSETGACVWESLPLEGMLDINGQEGATYRIQCDVHAPGADDEHPLSADASEHRFTLDASELVWTDDGLQGRFQLQTRTTQFPATIPQRILQISDPVTTVTYPTFTLSLSGSGVDRAYEVHSTAKMAARSIRLLGVDAPYDAEVFLKRGDIGSTALCSDAPVTASMSVKSERGEPAQTADLSLTWMPGDEAATMSIQTHTFNALYLTSLVAHEQSWGRDLLSVLKSVTLKADRLDVLGIGLHDARANIQIDGEYMQSVALTGTFAGGALEVTAEGLPFTGRSPHSLTLNMLHADAPALFRMAAVLLPGASIPACATGSLDFQLSYAREDSLRRVHAVIRKPLSFAAKGLAGFLQSLGTVRDELVALAPEHPDAVATGCSPLTFTSGRISASFATHLDNLQLDGEAEEAVLGPIRIDQLEKGVRRVDTFDLVLTGMKLPVEWPLSEKGRTAVMRVLEDSGLIIRASTTGQVSLPYVGAVRDALVTP